MNKIISLLILFVCFSVAAQNVGINTSNPEPAAALDVYSAGKGLLLTRLPLITTDNPSPLSAHVEGMVTYNTTTSPAGTPTSVEGGLYYNDGAKWNLMGPNTVMIGDIKHSLESADHKGWFLLDGRAVSTLSVVARYNAGAVGIGTNLPNAADRFVKSNSGSESVGSTAGNNTIVLTQANLPNVTYTATTSTTGNHNHTYSDSYNGAETLGLATNVLPLVPLITETVGEKDLVPANAYLSADSGSHLHSVSVSSGGSGVPINAKPKHIVTNVFIYLGE